MNRHNEYTMPACISQVSLSDGKTVCQYNATNVSTTLPMSANA